MAGRFFHTGSALVLCVAAVVLLGIESAVLGQTGAFASLPVYAFAFFSLLIVSAWAARFRLFRRWAAPGFHAAFIVHFGACFLFNAYFEDAVHRRYSFLDADADNLEYLVSAIFHWSVFFWLGAALLAAYCAAWWQGNRITSPRRFAGLLLLVSAGGTWLNDRPALHAFVASDVRDYLAGRTLEASDVRLPISDYSGGPHAIQGRYKRIILFVMESVTAADMERECSQTPCVFEKLAANSHVYTQYYAANQDSRTGILSLLFSRLIPYHAYAERDAANYQALTGKKGLLDSLARAGYETNLSAPVLDRERILMELPWTNLWLLNREEAQGKSSYLCFHPYEFEHSCEDRILMDRLVSYLRQDRRSFLLHEFIFGHSPEYNTASGKSSVRYYSDFIEEMLNRLGTERQDTLVIITSDHGIRDSGAAGRAATYHIPLMFYHPSFSRTVNTGFFSHMDFAQILSLEEAGHSPVSTRQVIPMIGATGSALLGLIEQNGSVTVIKNRRAGTSLHAQECRGTCLPAGSILPSLEVYRSGFQRFLTEPTQ